MTPREAMNMMGRVVTDSILNEYSEAADIIHEQAAERCTSCSWNTTISEETAIERKVENRVAVDDWKETGEIVRECPWCSELTSDNPHQFGRLIG